MGCRVTINTLKGIKNNVQKKDGMVRGILFTGININRVLEFCGDKASFYTELHVDSVKEKRELVVPTDFLFKSSKGNIRVVSWERFFTNFKQSDPNFEIYKLSHPFLLVDKNDNF